MPVAVVQDWPRGNDTTNYDAIHGRVMVSGTPDGFACTPQARRPTAALDFDVWESQDHFDRFVEWGNEYLTPEHERVQVEHSTCGGPARA